jgi:hypothetical protein
MSSVQHQAHQAYLPARMTDMANYRGPGQAVLGHIHCNTEMCLA